jgi:hypothetical protein
MTDLIAKLLLFVLFVMYVLWFLLDTLLDKEMWKRHQSRVENLLLIVMAILSVLSTVWIAILLLEAANGVHSVG